MPIRFLESNLVCCERCGSVDLDLLCVALIHERKRLPSQRTQASATRYTVETFQEQTILFFLLSRARVVPAVPGLLCEVPEQRIPDAARHFALQTRA